MKDNCIIEVRDLHKSFGDKHVLKGVTLDIKAGAVTTIIGKSGEGKSVLLKCIAGILQADSGTVDVACGGNGRGVLGQLSYMFQQNALFDSLTAFENVALPLREGTRMKNREIQRKVLGLFERLDLKGIGNVFPADLSGGMQKRVALARALVFDPRIVLFDEPTTGLDPLRKNAVFTMIERYQEVFGYTAVVVSHDLPDVLFFSDKVALLRGGVVSFFGTPLQLEQSETVRIDGFLHSLEDLQDELIGLEHRNQFRKVATEWRDAKVPLAVVTIDDFKDLEAGLGQLGAHLIERTLARCLRDMPTLASKRGFALERGTFAYPFDRSDATLAQHEWEERVDAVNRDLRRLGSGRCVDFAVKVALVDLSPTIDPQLIAQNARASGQTILSFKCS